MKPNNVSRQPQQQPIVPPYAESEIVAFTVVKANGLYQPYRLTFQGDRIVKREKIGTETMRQYALAKIEAEMQR